MVLGGFRSFLLLVTTPNLVPILGLVSIVPVDDEIEPFPFNCPTVLGTAASAGLRGKL